MVFVQIHSESTSLRLFQSGTWQYQNHYTVIVYETRKKKVRFESKTNSNRAYQIKETRSKSTHNDGHLNVQFYPILNQKRNRTEQARWRAVPLPKSGSLWFTSAPLATSNSTKSKLSDATALTNGDRPSKTQFTFAPHSTKNFATWRCSFYKATNIHLNIDIFCIEKLQKLLPQLPGRGLDQNQWRHWQPETWRLPNDRSNKMRTKSTKRQTQSQFELQNIQ